MVFFPALRVRESLDWRKLMALDLPIFTLATGSVLAFYLVSQRQLLAGWRGLLRDLPCLMAVGIGLGVNNTRAVLEAAAGRRTEFVRTPKLSIVGGNRPSGQEKYREGFSPLAFLELALGIYFTFVLGYAVAHRLYVSLPFLILFQTGYLATGLLSLKPALRRLPGLGA